MPLWRQHQSEHGRQRIREEANLPQRRRHDDTRASDAEHTPDRRRLARIERISHVAAHKNCSKGVIKLLEPQFSSIV